MMVDDIRELMKRIKYTSWGKRPELKNYVLKYLQKIIDKEKDIFYEEDSTCTTQSWGHNIDT